MTDKRDDDGFAARTRSLFDASVDSVDGRTRSKLTQARYAALAELHAPRRLGVRAWIALTGVTAVAVLGVWMGLVQEGAFNQGQAIGELPLDDFDIVAESANLELLEEVEFYAWIAAQPGLDQDGHSGGV